jgi:hypothetical protein
VILLAGNEDLARGEYGELRREKKGVGGRSSPIDDSRVPSAAKLSINLADPSECIMMTPPSGRTA